MSFHELLGKNLGGFESRRLAIGSPDAQTLLLEEIDNPKGQRIVWPDHGEIDLLFAGEAGQFGQVLRADIYTLDFSTGARRQRFLGDSRIARRAPHFFDVLRLRELPCQRMLAATRSND